MTVAFRYFARELLATVAVAFFTLLAIALGGRMIGYLQDVALGRYSADMLWTLAALRVPEFAQMTLPFALFLGVLMTVGRLHAEREFAVLQGGGADPRKMLGWLLAIAAPVAALVGALSLAVTPAAAAQVSRLAIEARANSEFEGISAGVFHTFGFGQRVTYARRVDAGQRRLAGVFSGERLPGGGNVTVWARAGGQHVAPDTGSRFLTLEDGVRYAGVPGARDFRVVSFRRLSQRVAARPTAWSRVDPRTLSTATLDMAAAEQAAEWHWRLGLPIVTLIAAVAAFGLGRAPPRQGRFARIVPGIVVFSLYFLFAMLAQAAIADGAPAAWLGLWPVHGAAALGAALMARQAWRPA